MKPGSRMDRVDQRSRRSHSVYGPGYSVRELLFFLFLKKSEGIMGKKDEKDTVRLGKKPPRFRFFLNPYQDARFITCLPWANKTGQRKLPLFIHIDPKQPVTLNKTLRYFIHRN